MGVGPVAGLIKDVLAGRHGPDPAGVHATSVFWLHHGTRLAGEDVTYRNHYLLARVGAAFGGCAFEAGAVDPALCAEVSGRTVADLLGAGPEPLRIAVLDAYLGAVRPHRTDGRARPVVLPAGPPEVRAAARDAAVAGLLTTAAGATVGLIGVVNPLVAAIRERGGEPLLCDLNLKQSRWGDPVTPRMGEVLDIADVIVATGMTLGNGSFDTILARCRERGVPLLIYAQTGSAVAREFLGDGVAGLSAEPFPYSQFSADETTLYLY